MHIMANNVNGPSQPWERPWWRGRWSAIMQVEKKMTWAGGLQAAANTVVLLGALALVAKIATGGGFVLQQQVQTEQQKAQTQQISEKVADLTSQVKQLREAIQAFPRPADYNAVDQHLMRLDQAIGAIGDRQTRDENDFNFVKGALQDLVKGTNTPVRQTR